MNTAAGTAGTPCWRRRLETALNSRIVGAADGSIIATIMTNHMPTSHASPGIAIVIVMPACADGAAACSTYAHARAASTARPAAVTIRSRRSVFFEHGQLWLVQVGVA